MLVSFTGTLRRVFAANGEGNPPIIVLRTLAGGSIAVDGKVIEPNKRGVSTLRLSVNQTDAFNAIPTDVMIAALTAGQVTLPDASRGKPTDTGDDLLAILTAQVENASEAASVVTEDDPQTDENAPQTDENASDEAPAPSQRSRRS